MEIDARTCYRALCARDARFDGRFFTGVVTTGVYCRPVCPARTPRARNCHFFPHAAAAAAAGFRPCLRCRPEAAPGTPVWAGTASTVARALRLIDAGALNADGVETLASRVGVGDRHLRRLFLRHLGATPLAVAQTQRVSFAKQLLDDTSLPMAAVARAAGFASVRRFNDAMRTAYRRPPSELRRSRGALAVHGARRGGIAVHGGGGVSLSLAFRPPYDWQALVRFLELRAVPGVESVRDGIYRRTFRIEPDELGDGAAATAASGVVEVRCDVPARVLRVHVRTAERARLSPRALFPIVTRLRRQFDLGADPGAIAAALAVDPVLAGCVRRRPGLRVPGAWDGFELAVRAVLGQQVSVRAATTVAGRIAHAHGEPVAAGDAALAVAFPAPVVLASADLTVLGLTRARARTVQALASEVAAGRLALDPGADVEATTAALQALPGIGAWTAEYIAMRALRAPDAFPDADLGLRRAYARLAAPRPSAKAGAVPPARATTLERAAEAWKPWRAYAALHLWTWEDPHASVDG
jgi:AraC family transcriptional regulator of adaptative response / DNA-3-methyladenine glycosylase II